MLIGGPDPLPIDMRGGSWVSEPGDLRPAGRYWLTTDYRDFFVGFRIARVLTP